MCREILSRRVWCCDVECMCIICVCDLCFFAHVYVVMCCVVICVLCLVWYVLWLVVVYIAGFDMFDVCVMAIMCVV